MRRFFLVLSPETICALEAAKRLGLDAAGFALCGVGCEAQNADGAERPLALAVEASKPNAAANEILRFAMGGGELIAAAPLTDVALAVIKSPAVMKKLRRIILAGGAVVDGDAGSLKESNICADPEAADIVFNSGVPVVMLPWDALSAPSRAVLADAAVAYAANEKISEAEYGSYTRVELKGEYTRGAAINDIRDRGRREFLSKTTVLYPYNCTIIRKLDEAKLSETLAGGKCND